MQFCDDEKTDGHLKMPPFERGGLVLFWTAIAVLVLAAAMPMELMGHRAFEYIMLLLIT